MRYETILERLSNGIALWHGKILSLCVISTVIKLYGVKDPTSGDVLRYYSFFCVKPLLQFRWEEEAEEGNINKKCLEEVSKY